MPYVCNGYCDRSDFRENTAIERIPHYVEGENGERVSSFDVGGFGCSVCVYFGVSDKPIVRCPCCGKQFKTGLFRQKRLLRKGGTG